MEKAKEILQKVWGFDDFRKNQDQIVASVLNNKDTLVLLPTGGGKSICYQVPGLLQEGLCLVISPLIALMQDQVFQLQKRGIKAVAITSQLSKKEIDILLDNAIYGQTKFLYVSPERLRSTLFLQRFEKMNINLIAVDEAHCISEWGYDFRPSYLKIAEIRKFKPNTPVLALTATATSEVVDDIQKRLNFEENHVISSSFRRDNLIYNFNQSNNKINRILEFLKNKTASGIVYCSTRKEVKFVCKLLIEKGISATIYHGGLNAEIRSQHQSDWLSGKSQLIVATNAFGMGIDKSNVRFVIHYSIPESIEAYFQEAGRAGRDGDYAEAHLFYEPSDIKDLEEKVNAKYPPLETIKQVYKALGNHFQLATGAGHGESFALDILEFCDKYQLDLIPTYNCFKFLELAGYLALSENFSSPSMLQIIKDSKELYQFQVKDENTNKVIQFLLRTQMGVFEDLVKINEKKIAQHTKLSEFKVHEVLNRLSQLELIHYIPQKDGAYITYLTERLLEQNLSIPAEIYHKRKVIALQKLEHMLGLFDSKVCTSQYLLEYFGEESNERCEKCCVCVSTENLTHSVDNHGDIESYLIYKFNQAYEVDIEEVIGQFPTMNHHQILESIRILIDEKKIKTDALGKKLSRI